MLVTTIQATYTVYYTILHYMLYILLILPYTLLDAYGYAYAHNPEHFHPIMDTFCRTSIG